ncbi:MAG TPA: carboxymuconolactone decarboxylase family protein [Rugosimonospora sp.]|nr:carboxymuconolactone decarboxylase family protein [Rugosimonospora sp.]
MTGRQPGQRVEAAAPARIRFPGQPRRPGEARLAPGGRGDLGWVNWALCRAVARRFGTSVPHVFSTLGRNRRLFRPWLRFAARLMPYGTLARADAELVILRVAVVCGSDYEWYQHVRLARRAGLTDQEIERVGTGPDAPGWTDPQRALLSAADELVGRGTLTDATWKQLLSGYDEARLIELCLLVGHYQMLAGTLNALGVQPEQE